MMSKLDATNSHWQSDATHAIEKEIEARRIHSSVWAHHVGSDGRQQILRTKTRGLRRRSASMS
eukprot:3004602-Prymnesium_polylepis.1